MADWKEELNQFLGDKGKAPSLTKFNQSEEIKIQEFLSEVFKTSLTKLKEQLNSYKDIKAEISTSKKAEHSFFEQVEFRVYKIMQQKFTYRLVFSKPENVINAQGQFSIPNLYGESIIFTDNAFYKPIAEIKEKDILEDFTKTFKEHFEKK
jgi:hypothetical protein